MVDEAKVLSVAADRIKSSGVVVYDDFSELKPRGKATGFWLMPVKAILLRNGYVCHESRKMKQWGNCGYAGSKTHFHRPK